MRPRSSPDDLLATEGGKLLAMSSQRSQASEAAVGLPEIPAPSIKTNVSHRRSGDEANLLGDKKTHDIVRGPLPPAPRHRKLSPSSPLQPTRGCSKLLKWSFFTFSFFGDSRVSYTRTRPFLCCRRISGLTPRRQMALDNVSSTELSFSPLLFPSIRPSRNT